MVMKTYLFETLNRYKRFSESLDAKAVLSNKAWVVFNDEGVYLSRGWNCIDNNERNWFCKDLEIYTCKQINSYQW